MQVGYSARRSCPTTHACAATSYRHQRCQSVGGRRIDGSCSTPCSRRAPGRDRGDAPRDRARQARPPTRVRSAELELERAQIHAERASRQFDACDPENRLVARTLEREWEQRLPTSAAPSTRSPTSPPGARTRSPTRRSHGAGSRRRPAQGVRRAQHHRPRAQAAAARDPHRRRRHRRPQIRATHGRAAGRMGRRPGHRAHRSAAHGPAATRAAPTRTRSRSCASSPSATPTSRSPRSSPAKDA